MKKIVLWKKNIKEIIIYYKNKININVLFKYTIKNLAIINATNNLNYSNIKKNIFFKGIVIF